ncbi:MAG TPA: hypothetical protein VGD72_07475 [Mycobacteriales bacterium]
MRSTCTRRRDTAPSCDRCRTAWSVASDATVKLHAAEAEATRARESERLAYAAAQDAIDRALALRRELEGLYRRTAR